MEPESFPNSKHLIQQAFAAQDPAPLLLELLKTHNHPALSDIVFYYFEAVQNDPYCAQKLASALSRTIKSPDAPSFGQNTLPEALSRVGGGALLVIGCELPVRE